MTQLNSALHATHSQLALDDIRNTVKETLEQVMGESSAEMLNEMASIFLEDALPLIDQMKDGYANGDYVLIRTSAHALKGSSATIGLEKFADICLAVETNSKQQQPAPSQIGTNLVALEAEYARVKQALGAFLF